MDRTSREELATRWAYRARLETAAAIRFRRLADGLERIDAHVDIVKIAREAAKQEQRHVELCTEVAQRFGVGAEEASAPTVPDIAPKSLSQHDQILYEMVAFCCITETANATVLIAGADDIDDTKIRRTVRTILADEVQHSQLGWRFLASHPLREQQLGWIGGYLPHMLRGAIREGLFAPAPIIGDELTMSAFGTLPVAGRREAFLQGMREIVFPGLGQIGVDISLGAAFLDELESAHKPERSAKDGEPSSLADRT